MKEQQVVVGGVDTHKNLHVAAVVDSQDRMLVSECFPSTRHGYKQMLTWMRSFGELARVGAECTGTYGAGLLRYLQQAGITVLKVTAQDRSDRRRRGKTIRLMLRAPLMLPLQVFEPLRGRLATA